jgi:hypothetical protein
VHAGFLSRCARAVYGRAKDPVFFMAQSPAAPASPDVKPGVRHDDLPVAEAQTELEMPYRVLIDNDDVTSRIYENSWLFSLVAAAPTGRCPPGRVAFRRCRRAMYVAR